jgi:hypothetical protein
MSKKNELKTISDEQLQVACEIPNGLSFGLETVTSKDIKIPLIYVAQAMSKVCADGLAVQGDIVENMENKVLGGKKGPAKVVPFFFQKSYQVQKLVNGKKEFHAIQPYDNERPYEEEKEGVTYFNYPCFNFFVLVLGDETKNKYMLSFRGSRNINSAGRPMLTQLMNSVQRGIPPYACAYDIGVKQVENEKGKWFVFTANADRDTKIPTDVMSSAAMEAKNLQTMLSQGAQIQTGEESIEEEAPF